MEPLYKHALKPEYRQQKNPKLTNKNKARMIKKELVNIL